MRRNAIVTFLAAAGAAALLLPVRSHAGTSVTGSIVSTQAAPGALGPTDPDSLKPPGRSGCFDPVSDPVTGRLKKRDFGKLTVKESKTPGDGGANFQLSLGGVDCSGAISTNSNVNAPCTTTPGVPYACCTGLHRGNCPTNPSCTGSKAPFDCCSGGGAGTCDSDGKCVGLNAGAANDGGVAGKCSQTNHKLRLTIRPSLSDLHVTVGIPFDLVGGKAVFQATGKNKVGAKVAQGSLVTGGFNEAAFIVDAAVHGRSTTATCPAVVVEAHDLTHLVGDPAPNSCLDGEKYGRFGFVQLVDPTVGCVHTQDVPAGTGCTKAQVCEPQGSGLNLCAAEPCTADADCDGQTGTSINPTHGGTHQCGGTTIGSTCCDPTFDPDCAGQVP